ncbi:MAG: SpoVG family protein [Candidatus Brocadiales bacterium]|nr:SpoVG family protein [Candidatus Bathyanammoxibius sp.]MCQ4574730.1 SpoVG family protein [Candidatus Bathyanammoxibius amoris]
MEITEIRVKLTEAKKNRLQAFCSITIDNDFVVRDLKVIEGQKGAFVAMPSRKLTDRCQKCGGKNHVRASYCNECGTKLDERHELKGESDSAGKVKLYADTAHPINSKCREYIQERVLSMYKEELERSTQPGYKPLDMPVNVDYENTHIKKDQEQRFGEGILP